MPDSPEFFHSIVESSVAGIVTIDSRGIVQSFSPAAERIFGYEESEVIGHNVSTLMPEPDHKSARRVLGELRELRCRSRHWCGPGGRGAAKGRHPDRTAPLGRRVAD